jgi:hypothetical protein
MDGKRPVRGRNRGIGDDGFQEEIGPACRIFTAATKAFPIILRVINQEPDYVNYESIGLRNEFRNFFVWNEGFPTSEGELDMLLSMSRNLREVVLRLMLEWARTVCRSKPTLSWV